MPRRRAYCIPSASGLMSATPRISGRRPAKTSCISSSRKVLQARPPPTIATAESQERLSITASSPGGIRVQKKISVTAVNPGSRNTAE